MHPKVDQKWHMWCSQFSLPPTLKWTNFHFQNIKYSHLNPKSTSFQIMARVLIRSTKGKIKRKNMGFLKFYDWQMLCWVVMSFFTK
jgi:hypothetical protein